jgi:hypothetical protein
VFLALALALAATRPQSPGPCSCHGATGGVTGYCLGPNGAIMPDPIVNVQTNGNSPSRLITSSDGKFLYVGETDQTEVWNIGPKGFLTRAGSIPDQPFNGINSHDIAIATSPDGSQNVLYQPQRRINRAPAVRSIHDRPRPRPGEQHDVRQDTTPPDGRTPHPGQRLVYASCSARRFYNGPALARWPSSAGAEWHSSRVSTLPGLSSTRSGAPRWSSPIRSVSTSTVPRR